MARVTERTRFVGLGPPLVAALVPPPLFLFGMAQLGLLPIPDADGPQMFLLIGLMNCVFAIPAFLVVARWISSGWRGLAYLICGVLAPLPAMFVVTMGYGALADAAELEGRAFALQVTPVIGGLSGLIFALLTAWRGQAHTG